MPKVTVRANARTLPEDDDEIAAALTFDSAYARWLKAKARSEDPDEQEDDEFRAALDKAERQAEREMFLTPAVAPWVVWRKLEMFEVILAAEMRDGERVDAFPMLAFGAIKADILALNLLPSIS